jgi:hypothetical protein
VGIFVASGIGFALTPAPEHPANALSAEMAALTSLSSPGMTTSQPVEYGVDLASLFLRPEHSLLWLLLLGVWGALLFHAWQVMASETRARRAAAAMAGVHASPDAGRGVTGPPTPQEFARQVRRENTPAEHAALTLALILGAAWPWVSRDYPVTGFMLAAAMFALSLTAALRGQQIGGAIRRLPTIGLFAGWATAVTYAAFATLVNGHLGIPPVAATAIAMLLCAGAGIVVQLRLGGSVSYSIAIIWSLVGLATATMGSDPTIATVAILGIAAMAIVLVRAAS